jgi:hypothetical protein
MSSAAFQARLGEAPGLASRRTIPFDYAFRYELTGTPGNVLNTTVSISVEATFVAVSIGYGVVPKVSPIFFGPLVSPVILLATPPPPSTLRDITLGQLLSGLDAQLQETSRLLEGETGAEAAFKTGIKLNPQFAERALLNEGNAVLDSSVLTNLFQAVSAPPEQIQFLYAIFDEGTGREFQSDPILNTAGLGTSNGERPFRYFARPISFAPRSTIRMQVTEVSEFQGELHVSLQGYKVLGGAGTPTGRIRQSPVRMSRR